MSTAASSPVLRRAAAETIVAREAARPTPLLGPAIALIVGIWLSETVGAVPRPGRSALCALPFVVFAASLFLRRHRTHAAPIAVTVIVIALVVGFTRHQMTLDRPPNHIVHALTDEPVLTRLAGRIVLAPLERPPLKLNPFLAFDPPPRTQFVMATDELRTTDPATPVTGYVRASVEATGLKLRLGQRVQLTGRLYRPRGPRNPGEIDWSRWYRQQALDAGMSVEGAAHVLVLPDPVGAWPRLVAAVRTTAQGLLFEPYADVEADPSARLLDVMVLGQRSVADQKLNDAFLRAGGMHFLAVSGFNVAVLAGAGWLLVRRVLRRSRRAAAVTTIVLALLFALVTEPNAPILRATICVVLAALADMTARPFCALNWLAAAAAGVLLCNPNELFGAAFQLTFVQVLALLTIVPVLDRWFCRTVVPALCRWVFERSEANSDGDVGLLPEARKLRQVVWIKLVRWSVGLAIVTTCAFVVAQPLVLLHFGRFAAWGWLGTLLLAPLVTFVTLLSLATLTANALLPPVGALLSVVLHGSTSFLLWTVGLFTPLPGAVIECSPPPVWLVAATYAAMLALVARRAPDGNANNPILKRQRVGIPGKGPQPESPSRALRAPFPSLALRALFPWRGRVAALAATAAVAFTWLAWALVPNRTGDGYALHVLDVGNGSTMLLTTPAGDAAVFDVGTDTNSDAGETAGRALRTLGVRSIEAAVISHANFDHFSGLPTLMRGFRVRWWFVHPYFTPQPEPSDPVARLFAELPPRARQPVRVLAGERLEIGGATAEVLWPPAAWGEAAKANDRSLVVRLTAAGRTVLLTGDIERAALEGLLEAERAGRFSLRADVLLAPHHGQAIKNITADFLAAVSPSTVIVSTRTPRPKLEKLVQDTLGPGGRIIATGDAGAVVVGITPDGRLRVDTPWRTCSGP